MSLAIDGAEIHACGDITRCEREIDATRRQDTAADVVDHWVIAEDREMARAASGSDPRCYWIKEPTHAPRHQRIKVRRARHLQLAPALLRDLHASQTIHDEKDHFRIGLNSQLIE